MANGDITIVMDLRGDADVDRRLQGTGRNLRELSRETDNVGQGASRMSRMFSGAASGIGAASRVAAGAVAAIGIATAAVATQGAREFAGFQRGMNEVFTLMPGASEQAMGAMRDDVRAFALEMRVTTDEVVPALYQSLSAGVPAGNVFDFLETAQQAALGGVTTLETAVDGISSVVNAYGEDVINAAEASDLMFTAVRLGKTTFDELAASLFQVNPTAAALGIHFGDMTAALAAMTAQGVPTSVATTQLRQMLVELGDATTTAGEAFAGVAGMSLQDFIAEGHNTAEALTVMQEAADRMDLPIQQLFGSVEAGNAALALTGANADSFASALAAMGESAGATQAAYDQMNQGLSRVWDRLKVLLGELWLSIGERLAPVLERFGNWVEANMPQIQATMTAALDGIVGFIEGWVIPAFMTIRDWWSTHGAAIVEAVRGFSENIVGAIGTVQEWVTDTFGEGGSARGDLTGFIDTAAGWGGQLVAIFDSAVDLALGIWDTFGDDLIRFVGRVWPAIQQIITGALGVIHGLLEVYAALFTADWDRLWSGFGTLFSGAWTLIQGLWDGALAFLRAGLDQFVQIWQSAWMLVTGGTEEDWQQMLGSLRDGLATATDNLTVMWTTITGFLAGEWDRITVGIRKNWDRMWDTVIGGAQRAWERVQPIIEQIREGFATVNSAVSNLNPFGGTAPRILGPVGTRATGGPVIGGMPYRVGELGPELFVPNASGWILNHQQTAAVAPATLPRVAAAADVAPRRGGDGAIYVQVDVHLDGADDTAAVERKMRAGGRALADELRRQQIIDEVIG